MSTKYRSVATKMTWVVLLVIAICGIGCSGAVYFYTNRTIVDLKKQELLLIHNEKNHQVSQELDLSLTYASLIAIRTRVVEYLEDQTASRRDELVGIFDEYVKDNTDYLAVYLMDATGTVHISTDRTLVQKNYAFRNYFKQAITGRPYVDAVYGVTTKQMGFYFSYPVIDKRGQPIGVVVVKRSPESIYSDIMTDDAYGQGTVMVTDEYGVVVYATREDRLFHSIGPLTEKRRSWIVEEQRYGEATLSALQYDTVQEAITNKDTPKVVEFYDEEDRETELLSVQQVSSYPFYFVYEIQMSGLSSIAIRIVAIILGFVLVGIVIAMTVVSLVMKNMLRPLSLLRDVAARASEGNVDQQVVVTTGDEFEAVAVALTAMFGKIRSFTSSLDAKVKEQTALLEDNTRELENKQKAMLNLLEDVEAEKVKSQQLARDLQKFQLAVEHASDHIVITDSDGVILYANNAVERITGFSNKEIVGQKAGTKPLWGGLMDSAVYAQFWKTIKEQKQIFIGEFNNHRKNGEAYIAEAHVAPILDAGGNVQFFVGIERDITHAKEVDRMKTEFISLASHQLRTPLSAMKWFSEMLLAGDAGTLTDEQKEYIGNIDQSNERMIALVNSLLNISRIESGRIIIEPEATDIRVLIQKVVQELQVKIDEKKIVLVTSIHEGLPPIMLDPKLIWEVYKNLLTNAIKYTPEGGEITIFVSRTGDALVSQVSDTGYGIPKSEQHRVFERFYRGGNIIKLETEGTGLGLYLVKAIVESSGGKVWFESEEGKGTSFYFSLPISGMKKKEGEVTINA